MSDEDTTSLDLAFGEGTVPEPPKKAAIRPKSKRETEAAEEDPEKKEGRSDAAKCLVMWLRPSGRKKLGIAKQSLGVTWGAMAEIVVEQLAGSGVLDQEAIDAINRVSAENPSELVADQSWKEAHGIHTRWSEAGTIARQIGEEATKLRAALEDLIDVLQTQLEADIEREDCSDL